jgi:GNAT superfamily N-acetyltransferase
MADAVIDRINPADLDLVAHLYNSMFRPEREPGWFARRLEGRRGPVVLVARVGQDAVGFYIGFELKPNTHFAWLVGVASDMRRTGIATQLMHAAERDIASAGYEYLRFECLNQVRSFLHFGIANAYDIVGIRWDQDRMGNLVIFEKAVSGSAGEEPSGG